MPKGNIPLSLAFIQRGLPSSEDRLHAIRDAQIVSLGCEDVKQARERLIHIAKRDARKREARKLEALGLKRPGVNKPKAPLPVDAPIERVPERAPQAGVSKWQTIGRPAPHGARPRGWCATGVARGTNGLRP